MRSATLSPAQLIDNIAQQWHPQSDYCQFRHIFYNLVPPQDVQKYEPPKNLNPKLQKFWQQANENNPNPLTMVPVQAIGFKDLKARVIEQDKTTQLHLQALQEISSVLQQMHNKHSQVTKANIEAQKIKHMQLSHRLLRVTRKIEMLRNRGQPIAPWEEHLRARLENLQRELNKPTQLKGRLNELSSLVRMQEQRRPHVIFEAIDETDEPKIFEFLSELQNGLSHLTEILKVDMRNLQVMMDHQLM